jgi:glycosidase
MLDWVANHTSWDNPWIKNKSWFLTDSLGNIISPPGFHWDDVAQLNFKNADMRMALIKSMKYWVLTANIDGFRCDYADGPPADFWVQAIDTLRNMKGRRLLFLAEGNRRDLFPDGFDYNFGFKFYGNLRQVYRRGKPVRSIDSINRQEYEYASAGQQMVRYLTNHDVNGSDGTPLQLFGGERGSMAAFVIVAYMDGVPFIYNGQEVGMTTRLVFPFTRTKIDWTPDPPVTAEYKRIIAFRNASKAIRRGTLTSFSSADVCAFLKQAGREKVLVLSNLRNKAVSFSIPGNLTGSKWKNVFNHQISTLGASIDLPPYTYLVFKN